MERIIYRYSMEEIRKIGIIGEVEEGKRSVVEKMMVGGEVLGKEERKGEVVLDKKEVEGERGIRIVCKKVWMN